MSSDVEALLAIRNLVGALLGTVDDDLSAADHHGSAGELQDLLMVERSGLSFLQSFDGVSDDDARWLAAAVGAELAKRRTPVADLLLASLAFAGAERGLPEFEHSWSQRISEGSVDPRGLTLGSNRVVDDYVEGMAQVRRRFDPLIEDAEKHQWQGAKPTRPDLTPVGAGRHERWKRPEKDVELEKVHVEGDPSAIPPDQYGKTTLIVEQVTLRATGLLGPSFAQPALDLTIAIACAEPCPFDNTQISSWPAAIVWFLAEESDVFDRSTAGRRRYDLAAMLPMTRATYETKAKRIRAALGSVKGDWKVPHTKA